MATKMNVLGVYQANVHKSDLAETFEMMLEEWFKGELFEMSSSEAKQRLLSVLSESRCSRIVGAHIQELCDSSQLLT